MASRQSADAIKLERLQQLAERLKEDLDRKRIPVSEAAKSLIDFTTKAVDPLVHSSGMESSANPFIKSASSGGCELL